MAEDKLTASAIRARKGHEKIAVLTAYDATFARIFDAARVDVLLVGDSLGMVVQGLPNTLAVTLDDIIYHTRAVARGTSRALVVGDLPFMSYQISPEQAVASAGRLVKEGGAEAVKLEGGSAVCPGIVRMIDAGIPVMGHLGLTPQSVNTLGGVRRVQGRGAAGDQLLADAHALQDAGAFAVVLESVPADLGRRVSAALRIPTVGIGAGPYCDAQILVWQDMAGLTSGRLPRFVKRYASLRETLLDATRRFTDDVSGGRYPDAEHSYT